MTFTQDGFPATFLTRLYCDFDGIIHAKEPAHDDVERFEIRIEGSDHLSPVSEVIFSPTVVRTIERLRDEHSLELVWLTTWNENNHVLKLSNHLRGLDYGRVLPAALNKKAKNKAEWTEWKYKAIIADQQESEAPFIWIDDNAIAHHGNAVKQATTTDSLFIIPNSLTGLTIQNLDDMEAFLNRAGA